MLFCLILIIELNYVSLSSFTDERPKGQICPPNTRQILLLNWNLVPVLFSLLQRCYMNASFHNVMTWELENTTSIQASPWHSKNPSPLLVKCGGSESQILRRFPRAKPEKSSIWFFFALGLWQISDSPIWGGIFYLRFSFLIYVCQTLGPYCRIQCHHLSRINGCFTVFPHTHEVLIRNCLNSLKLHNY